MERSGCDVPRAPRTVARRWFVFVLAASYLLNILATGLGLAGSLPAAWGEVFEFLGYFLPNCLALVIYLLLPPHLEHRMLWTAGGLALACVLAWLVVVVLIPRRLRLSRFLVIVAVWYGLSLTMLVWPASLWRAFGRILHLQ